MKYFEQFYARKLDNLDEMGKFQERQKLLKKWKIWTDPQQF